MNFNTVGGSPKPVERSRSMSDVGSVKAPVETKKPELTRRHSSPEIFKSDEPVKTKLLTSPETISKAVEKAKTLGSSKIKGNLQKLNKGFWNKMAQKFEGSWLGKQLGFKASKVYAGGGGGLKLPDDFDLESSRVPNPGKKMQFSKDVFDLKMTMTGEDGKDIEFTTDVKKGQHAVVTKIPDQPGKVKIQLYSYKKSETGGDKTLELGATGIVDRADLSHFVKKTTHRTFPKDLAIFQHPPTTSDIHQGAIGDCFLLAGLSAMVKKDPSMIEDLIRDNGDGSVTVKMFDVVKGEDGKPVKVDGKKQFTEKFITFDKSVVNNRFAIVGQHARKGDSAPWVPLLEKAYTIHLGSYALANEGGHASDVFEAFTGKTSQTVDIKDQLSPKDRADTIRHAFSHSSYDEDTVAEGLRKEIHAFQQANSEAIEEFAKDPDGTVDQLKEIMDTKAPITIKGASMKDIKEGVLRDDLGMDVTNDAEGDKLLKTMLPKIMGKTFDTKSEFRLALESVEPPVDSGIIDKIVDKISPAVLSEDAKKVILDRIDTRGVYDMNGTTGSGEYNQRSLDTFDRITQRLSDGVVLAGGTRSKVGIPTGTGHSGGESVSHGLVGGHAYSITGTVTLNPGDDGYPGPKDGPPLKFIKITNPWGEDTGVTSGVKKLLDLAGQGTLGGFEYKWDKGDGVLKRVAKDKAESLIELSEFTKYFHDTYELE